MTLTIRATLAALLLAPTVAPAAVLFDSTASNSTTFFSGKPANDGTGQIVAIEGLPKTITSFGFVMTAEAGTSVKFFINFGRTQNLLTRELTLTRAYTRELVLSPEFTFVVPSVNQYTFGFVTTRGVQFQADTDGKAISQNGITEIPRSNPNYVNYNPPLYDRDGLAEIALQINGTSGGATAPVPEPATWALMLTGFGLAGCALRRRPKSASVAAA